MIRLGSLAGYPFEGPRVLAGWTAPPVAGALPLLYGMAEEIVTDVTPAAEPPLVPEPARPASGRRRSRLHDAVGFTPHA